MSACRYEKYDTNAVTRERTDDPFQDELNLVADKVQDMQLVGRASLAGSVLDATKLRCLLFGKQRSNLRVQRPPSQ